MDKKLFAPRLAPQTDAVNEAGGKCVVTGLNENVMGVLKLTKLDKLFTIEKTLAKAQKRLLK